MTGRTKLKIDYQGLLGYKPRADLLAGRVILVTGAADGIGRAVALAYAAHGARLILLDWNRKALDHVHDEIGNLGFAEPVLCPIDFSGVTIDGLRDVVRLVEERFGALDGLLNNASWIGALSPFEHYAPKTWLKVMNINLAAPFFLTQWCMPVLRKAVDPVIGFFTARNKSRLLGWIRHGQGGSGSAAACSGRGISPAKFATRPHVRH